MRRKSIYTYVQLLYDYFSHHALREREMESS
jgi:hypothetical protein